MKTKTFVLACLAVALTILAGPLAFGALTEHQLRRLEIAFGDRDTADAVRDAADLANDAAAAGLSGAELDYLDITTAGAAEASKAVVLNSVKAVTGIGHVAPAAGATFTAADPNPSRTTLRANSYFLVDTTANAVDLDFSNDADLEAADLGKEWEFLVSAGGTNALTVTDGASGVLVKLQAAAGATCEDPGDRYKCRAYALEAISCTSFCAD